MSELTPERVAWIAKVCDAVEFGDESLGELYDHLDTDTVRELCKAWERDQLRCVTKSHPNDMWCDWCCDE